MSTETVVEHIIRLTDNIIKLTLRPKIYVDYEAGQYLKIQLINDLSCYSIANAPLGSHTYDLHIRHEPCNQKQTHFLNDIKKHAIVTIQLPFGQCRLSQLDYQLPIIFIAAGTGFAPINAMIEQLIANEDSRFIELYWCVRTLSDLYLDETVNQWQASTHHFHYFPKLSLTVNARDTLIKALLTAHPDDLNTYQFVLAGPFDFVYAIRDMLVLKGISPTRLYSDAFSFE
jgi:CDP-4-dehydro-6-deoxyglucose reductase